MTLATLALLISFACPQDDSLRLIYAPNSRVHVATPGAPSPGYFLISSIDPDSIGFIDNAGVLVHAIQTGPTTNLEPTPYGGVTYFNGNLQKYVLLDDRLNPIDTFGTHAPYKTDFHEGYQERGRRFIVIGTEDRQKDMSMEIPGGDPYAILIGAVIQEFDRYGRKTFEWKSIDHVGPNESTDDVDVRNKRIDYIHVNSVVEDVDDNFLVSCRNTDQVIKINRKTGAIMWRLGGKAAKRSDFTIIGDDVNGFSGFSHQHSVFRARNGDIMMFDNGNLRPYPFSRAVSYKLDEKKMIATKQWEFQPQQKQFAPTMGSVQELFDGNILIGWGSTPTGLVATEVDRSNTIHAEIRTDVPLTIPYRVRKATAGMTGYRRTIDSAGSYNFAWYDSTTKARVDVQQVYSPTTVVIERHPYQPHNLLFFTDVPCLIYPTRWTVRAGDPTAIDASLRLDVSRLIGNIEMQDVELFHRAIEGDEPFSAVDATVLPNSNTFVISPIRYGEYMIATKYCQEPALTRPMNRSDVASRSVDLSWTTALGADGYEIEVSTEPDFKTTQVFMRTQLADTVISGLHPNTTYYWHVRVVRHPESGPWTVTWSFETESLTSVDEDINPLSETVFLDGSILRCGGFGPESTVRVTDILGRVSAETNVNNNGVDLSEISRGILFVTVHEPNGTVTCRTIINP
ncbi:MAG: aryl-sulfate sulfotransferase [Candidatus Kapabacteria bacterium]|nr:aryl-sulfate sulfotransferase [Candidatus Kapabacteria bacterium]